MPGEKAQNLQDAFLNHVRKQKVPVTIFLVNGVKLQGVITWFDNFCLLLRRDAQSQLVYKHAISTILPMHSPFEVLTGFAPLAAARGSLQDVFLAASAREQAAMTLFLVNGVMLQGNVAGFDQFCVILERDQQLQLVYKHAISTLQPPHALDLGDNGAGEGGE